MPRENTARKKAIRNHQADNPGMTYGEAARQLDAQQTAAIADPWKPVDSEGERPRLPRTDLETYLDHAEARFRAEDPYERQAGYASASKLYAELASHTDDPTWTMAAQMAGQMYAVLAARVRWEHQIPTIFPKTEANYLHLGTCQHCNRPWQGSLDGACEHCPRLSFGPTPDSREDAARFPAAKPIDLADLHTPHHQDDD